MTRVTALGLALALCVPATVSAAPAYVAVPLGSLGGLTTYGAAINAAGQVAGWGDTDGTGPAHRHAFLFSNGTITNLGTFAGGTQSFAYALNDAGQIVGSSNGLGVPQLHAARFSAGTVTDLNTLLGASISSAYGINARGDFVGGVSSGGPAHAYRYLAANGIVTDLGTFGGTTSQAYGVNASGSVTGFAHVPSQDAHAFRYDGAGLVDLGTLGGNLSIGRAIGPTGHVVGESYLPGNVGPHAFFHNGISMADLGTLGGSVSSALGINATDTIVGEATNAGGGSRAFVHSAGSMVDLNAVTSGLNGATLTTATAVNDAGQIVAMSCTALLVCPQAFRLDPGVELNQQGLTGSWYEPATSGQGFEVEVFPNFIGPDVGLTQVSWFTFDTTAGAADRQRWYTLNATCSTTSARPTNADFALSGNWYNPSTAGQGFTVEVSPGSSTLFLAWYTYAPAAAGAGAEGQRWYTGQGAFSPGMRSISFTFYETTGGTFDSVIGVPHSLAVGTGTLVFQSCSGARFDFNFTGGSSSGTSGAIALSRIGPVPQGCVQ